jgi:uncharacterized lipoprotein YmbA
MRTIIMIALVVLLAGCASCPRPDTFGSAQQAKATDEVERCDCNVDYITLPEWLGGSTITLNPNANCFNK